MAAKAQKWNTNSIRNAIFYSEKKKIPELILCRRYDFSWKDVVILRTGKFKRPCYPTANTYQFNGQIIALKAGKIQKFEPAQLHGKNIRARVNP